MKFKQTLCGILIGIGLLSGAGCTDYANVGIYSCEREYIGTKVISITARKGDSYAEWDAGDKAVYTYYMSTEEALSALHACEYFFNRRR